MARLGSLDVARTVLRTELRSFLRDRRALISAVVLPVVLYPLVFFANTWLERVSRETMAARKVTIGLDLSAASQELVDRLRHLLQQEPPIELVDIDAARLVQLSRGLHEGRPESVDTELRIARELLADGRDALVTAVPHPVLAARLVFRLHHDGSDDLSNEAERRARSALAELERAEVNARLESVLGAGDPARGLDALSVDVASPEQTGGAALARFLPLLAVLVLLSGGAYGALSAFAGEREAQTLETLLVQPVPAAALAWGKFAAVLLLAVAALVSNAGSLVGSLALGLGRLPGMDEAAGLAGLVPGVGRLAVGATAFLPAAVLLCAVLCWISARSRSFREGQHAILPLTLVAALPAAAAGFADIELDALTGLTPLLGSCLALRDAVQGKLALLPGSVAFVAGWAWSWLALRRLAALLDAERVLSTEGGDREQELRGTQSRAAIAWGLAAALLIYVVGGWLQGRRPLLGLMLTLWVLAPTLALLAARRTARRARIPLAEVLSLRLPRPAHLLGALLAAPALAALMRAWVPLQQRLLPMPSGQLTDAGPLAELTELSPWMLFLALALSPAICEELLFRGAVQGGLARDLSARKVALWQALLFGLAHASVYRFLPTAVLGAGLSLVVWRSASLLPAVLLHGTYNALLVLGGSWPALEDPRLAWLAVLGVPLLALPGHRPASAAASRPTGGSGLPA